MGANDTSQVDNVFLFLRYIGFPEDMFGGLFGGLFGGMGGPFGFGGMGGGRHRRRKGEDTYHPLSVTLEDLYNGKTSKLQLSKQVICPKCKGYVHACFVTW